uniref:hypothetical protein n=1 Tax=Chitinophaga sancti TaxID=1004 RepID=UPI003F7ADFE8
MSIALIMITYWGANAFSKPGPNVYQPQKQLYNNTYTEMTQMLSGRIPVNFKKAVFLMENAYLD